MIIVVVVVVVTCLFHVWNGGWPRSQVQKSADDLLELVLSMHCVVPSNQREAVRLSCKHRCPLSHLYLARSVWFSPGSLQLFFFNYLWFH